MPSDETTTLHAPSRKRAVSGRRLAEREPHSDRRGPFRPKILAPTRLRLAGRLMTRLFQGGDALSMVAAGVVVFAEIGDTAQSLEVSAAGGLAVLIALSLFNTYGFSARQGLLRQLARVSAAFAIGASVAVLALLSVAQPALLIPPMQVWTPTAWALVCGLHLAWWLVVRHWRATGRLTPNVIVVGATGAAERLIASMLNSREVNVLGLFDDRAARSPRSISGVPVLGDTKALLEHRIMPFVDRIVISVPSAARVRVAELIERLRVLPNEITLLLDGEDDADEAAAIGRIADVPLALISGVPANETRALVKRMQDVVFASLALIPALPIMGLVALAIRLDSPGPVLFRQRRHGFNNEEIIVWKFRSMKVESADARATRQISANDDRVTKVGKFIRRTSLDELPQIFNVLTGQMSLVGPRPHAIGMMTGDVESARLVAEYAHRHRMKPGMTGWAAVHGSRGPVDTPELVQKRVAYDVEYIQRQSFWLDLWIMLITIPCLLGDSEAVR